MEEAEIREERHAKNGFLERSSHNAMSARNLASVEHDWKYSRHLESERST